MTGTVLGGIAGVVLAVIGLVFGFWGFLLALVLGLVGALAGLRAWGGPSHRYEAPDGGGRDVAGPRGERVASDWDELSAGRDPTDVGRDGPT